MSKSTRVEIQMEVGSPVFELHELCNKQVESLEYTIAKFILEQFKDNSPYVCGLYSMTGAQSERFDAFVKRFVTPIKSMKMFEYETFVTFLDRRLQQINHHAEQFESTKELLLTLLK